MKKIITILTLVSILAIPVISFAAVDQQPVPEAPFEDIGGFLGIIEDIGNWIFTGLLILAGIFLVVAGYYFVTAGGNPEGVNKARQMMINALIGVAVGLASKGLVAVVTNLINSAD